MKKGFIFDLEGTVYVENNIIEGASEAISILKKRGDKGVFLTNKSIEAIPDYVDKLNRFGIEVSPEEFASRAKLHWFGTFGSPEEIANAPAFKLLIISVLLLTSPPAIIGRWVIFVNSSIT